ncbi:MAG: adenosine kinase [Candidatus Woesearchaeota archaeon]|nr:adenosine kinase [Candidatus Woesearchaeota archaeon]
MKKYDVFGIGSALMDFLVEVDHKELLEMDLKHGEMHLIDKAHSKKIFEKLKKYKFKIAPGGSAANVLAGVAVLGGKVVFCGKVGQDEHGAVYEQKMTEGGVFSNIKKGSLMTGHTITFITPDFERTFATHLGAALELGKEDVLEEELRQSKILHIEGYQLEGKAMREVAIHAMEIAKNNNVLVSIDLADPALIRRNLEDMKNLVKKYADIVFANEKEAEAFTGKKEEAALDEIAEFADVAVVKLGSKGSLIKSKNRVYKINSFEAKAVDTTGAGDMYAAGILYGISHDLPLEKAGKIASYAAAKVVEQIGARLSKSLKDEIKKLI